MLSEPLDEVWESINNLPSKKILILGNFLVKSKKVTVI